MSSAARPVPSRSREGASGEASQAVANALGANSPRGVTFHDLPHFRDARGELIVAELNGRLPFAIERLFFVQGVPEGGIRGQHAHRSLRQLLIALRGACTVLADDGERRQEFRLDTPSHGLYLPPMIWSSQYQFTRDAVLLVLASAPYDPSDYIRNYPEFQELARG